MIELSISQPDPLSFLMAGAAYWAQARHRSSPFYLAPFEIEFHFAVVDAEAPSQIVIRFGCADPNGEIVRTDLKEVGGLRSILRLIDRRPTCNSDWAFAVVLT